MYKLLEGGIKKLKSALISVITTAGFDLKSPCYKLYEYCCNLLKGIFENDAQFAYIAQMDEGDDLWKPENWIKANPILAFDRDALENLIPVAATAKDMGGEAILPHNEQVPGEVYTEGQTLQVYVVDVVSSARHYWGNHSFIFSSCRY